MAQVTPTVPGSTSSIAVRRRSGEEVRVPQVMVYPRYFTTIGIPVTSGREFTSSDLATGAAAVCIVNASFARQVFAGEDPIGKPCQTARRPRLLDGPTERVDEPYTIVGVVADSPYNNPRGETQPLVYTTFLQTNTGRGQMVLHVRASGAPGQLVHRIREQVASVDPAAPMFDVRTLQEEMNAALGQQRLIAMLSSAFGALALLLASVGLYGLLSFSVEQRRRELGLRLALGANRRDVAVMVARDAMRLAGIGIAIGVPVALACAKVLASRFEGLLFGIEAGDRGTIGAAVLVLAAVAALAAYLPARRASRVDPMLVLRVD
jgi:predicted permease